MIRRRAATALGHAPGDDVERALIETLVARFRTPSRTAESPSPWARWARRPRSRRFGRRCARRMSNLYASRSGRLRWWSARNRAQRVERSPPRSTLRSRCESNSRCAADSRPSWPRNSARFRRWRCVRAEPPERVIAELDGPIESLFAARDDAVVCVSASAGTSAPRREPRRSPWTCAKRAGRPRCIGHLDVRRGALSTSLGGWTSSSSRDLERRPGHWPRQSRFRSIDSDPHRSGSFESRSRRTLSRRPSLRAGWAIHGSRGGERTSRRRRTPRLPQPSRIGRRARRRRGVDPFVGSAGELVERARLGPARALMGSDTDDRALESARSNLEAAGVHAHLHRVDALDWHPNDVTLIITNPPMGRRASRTSGLAAMLDRFVAQPPERLSRAGASSGSRHGRPGTRRRFAKRADARLGERRGHGRVRRTDSALPKVNRIDEGSASLPPSSSPGDVHGTCDRMAARRALRSSGFSMRTLSIDSRNFTAFGVNAPPVMNTMRRACSASMVPITS